MDTKKIGFIGLGIMGRPMAKNLLKAGYELIVNDIDKEAVAQLAALGAEVADTAANVAEAVDIIITMLPNSPHVTEVVCGKNGIIEKIRPGAAVIDMSSIAPAASQAIAAKLKEKGAEMLDAPVSGGEPKAVDGTLAVMVGGDEKIFGEVRDILLVMGSSATYVGEIGSGNVAKLANQMIVALNIAALSEALVLAAKSGVDPENVFNAIKGGLAGSAVMNAKAPMMFERNFKPGFRVELHIKDLMNAMDTAHENNVPAPLTASVLEMLQSLKVHGSKAEDHSAILKYYERLAGMEIGGKTDHV
ncbi:MAG: 2-hydroxy-3-oxopropionate reductase [Oscillospiraceae bacterium]|nr:2-hydroxy-3-oxopropionate reductase [Oscillospiraceae bacterium]